MSRIPFLGSLSAVALAFTVSCDNIPVVSTDVIGGPDASLDAGRMTIRDAGTACTGDACVDAAQLDGSAGDAWSRDAGNDSSDARDEASAESLFPADYPHGPYGALVGDTITDLSWQGYVNPNAAGLASAEPFASYTMDDLRKSGHALALLHVSDFDCPGCNHAANDLGQLGKSIVDMGVGVVEVLASHAFSLPATKAYLDAWVSSHDLAVTSVIDADSGLETLNTVGVRETALIIDLSTMKILWRFQGDLGGTDPSSVTHALAELKRRLGD